MLHIAVVMGACSMLSILCHHKTTWKQAVSSPRQKDRRVICQRNQGVRHGAHLETLLAIEVSSIFSQSQSRTELKHIPSPPAWAAAVGLLDPTSAAPIRRQLLRFESDMSPKGSCVKGMDPTWYS